MVSPKDPTLNTDIPAAETDIPRRIAAGIRAYYGANVSRFARAMNTDNSTVNGWLRGVKPHKFLEPLATALHMNEQELLHGSGPEVARPAAARKLPTPERQVVRVGSAWEDASDPDTWLSVLLDTLGVTEPERRRAICNEIDDAAGHHGMTPRLVKAIATLYLNAERGRPEAKLQPRTDPPPAQNLERGGLRKMPKKPRR